MPDTYYKVVSVKRKNKKVIRTSWLGRSRFVPPFLILRYIPGKLTKPKVAGTKLMVFNTLEDALRLTDDHRQIWECTVTNPKRLHHIKSYRSMGNATKDGIKQMWNILNEFDHTDDSFSLEEKAKDYIDISPMGTYACDTVTLTRQVIP